VNIPVAYEDDYLVVLDKPSGLLTVPTPKNESRTLESILNDDLKARGVGYRLYPCHRLDRETSGLIIFAKGQSARDKMVDAFRQRMVHKVYTAFVQGLPHPESGEIRKNIEGKEAITKYKVVAKKRLFAILEVTPLTGRTNQLRIHFKSIGHPIVGESKFAFRKDFALKFKRLCLHAAGLTFKHPVTGKPLRLSAPLPQDMGKFLESHD
jgi:23S rRNA pseudouridine1911/1915/1917 synthase